MSDLRLLLPIAFAALQMGCVASRADGDWIRAETTAAQHQQDQSDCRALAESSMRPEHEYELMDRCMRQRGYSMESKTP
jgi:hypothetical protein